MPRVLLVDDEQEILIVLDVLFSSEGYDVTSVNGGPAAVEVLKTERFDLLVSDIRMDGVNGFDLAKLAKAEYSHMPVILVSGYDLDRTETDILEMGVSAFLRKPFDNDELLSLAQKALAERSPQ